MSKVFAVVPNGVVLNIVVADSPLSGDWVDVTGRSDVGIHYTMNSDGSFSPPEAPAPVVLPNHISVGAFYDRLGDQKYPILASTDPVVQALIKDVSVRKYVDLDRPDVLQGLQMIQQAGFAIDPEAIVTAPVNDNERP